MVCAVAESCSDDDLDKVELDEYPPEAHNQEVAPLPVTNFANYAKFFAGTGTAPSHQHHKLCKENPSYFAGKRYFRSVKLSFSRIWKKGLEAATR